MQNDANKQDLKQPYSTPEFEEYGTIQEITLGGFSSGSDAEATGEFVLSS